MKKYTDTHEWVKIEGVMATIGLTKYSQKLLENSVYLSLPMLNLRVVKGEEIAVVESTKAAIDICSPLTGTVKEINESLQESPEMINQSNEEEVWLFKMEIENPQELDILMNAQAYLNFSNKI